MIEFRALMHAIHNSVKQAARNVESETIDFLDRFFEQEEDKNGEKTGSLRPITVAMQFPSRTPDGVKVVDAEIPLLTLCPVSAPKITEVKFTTELEVSSGEDDKLMVSFPSPKKAGMFSKEAPPSDANAKVEITLTGGEPPEGLKKLIEGYERALRAQIPG